MLMHTGMGKADHWWQAHQMFLLSERRKNTLTQTLRLFSTLIQMRTQMFLDHQAASQLGHQLCIMQAPSCHNYRELEQTAIHRVTPSKLDRPEAGKRKAPIAPSCKSKQELDSFHREAAENTSAFHIKCHRFYFCFGSLSKTAPRFRFSLELAQHWSSC